MTTPSLSTNQEDNLCNMLRDQILPILNVKDLGPLGITHSKDYPHIPSQGHQEVWCWGDGSRGFGQCGYLY